MSREWLNLRGKARERNVAQTDDSEPAAQAVYGESHGFGTSDLAQRWTTKNHLAGSRTMLNHDHERRHYGIQKVEAAGRGSPSARQASDGDPVPRIACGSGTDCEGVLGRLRGATEATFADHRVPLQRFSQVEGEEGRRRTITREEPSRGSSAGAIGREEPSRGSSDGAIGREAQCGNCWTSEAAGDGEEEARQGQGLRKANQSR